MGGGGVMCVKDFMLECLGVFLEQLFNVLKFFYKLVFKIDKYGLFSYVE